MEWSWTFPFGNPRQRENMNELKDKDFDGELQSGKAKLDDILAKEADDKHCEFPERSRNGGFSFHKFSSVTTKKSAGGVRVLIGFISGNDIQICRIMPFVLLYSITPFSIQHSGDETLEYFRASLILTSGPN